VPLFRYSQQLQLLLSQQRRLYQLIPALQGLPNELPGILRQPLLLQPPLHKAGAFLVQRRAILWAAYRSLTAQHLCYLRKVQNAMAQGKPPVKALRLFKSWEHSDACLPPEAGALRHAVAFLKSRERGQRAPSDDIAFDTFCSTKGIIEPQKTRVLLSTITLRQRLGVKAVQDLRADAPLPVLQPAPLVFIPLCARPACRQQVPPIVRCSKCHFRCWCSTACRSKHKERHADTCWASSTQPQLPLEDSDPWIATAPAFDVRTVTAIQHQPLSMALSQGLVPQVHPWFGVLYAPPSMQAVNYPLPEMALPAPDGAPDAPLEAEVMSDAPPVEAGTRLLGSSAPLSPSSSLHRVREWLQEGPQGASIPLAKAPLTRRARVVTAGFRGQGPLRAAFAQFLDKKGHTLLPALADLMLARLFRPRLQGRRQIFPPSDSALIRRHLAARAPVLSRRDRRRAPPSVATTQALQRLKRALRSSLVTYIPYQQGEWWVLLCAERVPGAQTMSIACFNPPLGANGKLGIMRFINHCEQQCGFQVQKTRPLQAVCDRREHSGLHMLCGLAGLIAGSSDTQGGYQPRFIPLEERPIVRALLVASLGTPSPRSGGSQGSKQSPGDSEESLASVEPAPQGEMLREPGGGADAASAPTSLPASPARQ